VNSGVNVLFADGDTNEEKKGNFSNFIHGHERKLVWGDSASLYSSNRLTAYTGVNTNLGLDLNTNVNFGPTFTANIGRSMTFLHSDTITQGPGSICNVAGKVQTLGMEHLMLMGGANQTELQTAKLRWKTIALSLTGLLPFVAPPVNHFSPNERVGDWGRKPYL